MVDWANWQLDLTIPEQFTVNSLPWERIKINWYYKGLHSAVDRVLKSFHDERSSYLVAPVWEDCIKMFACFVVWRPLQKWNHLQLAAFCFKQAISRLLVRFTVLNFVFDSFWWMYFPWFNLRFSAYILKGFFQPECILLLARAISCWPLPIQAIKW